MPILRPLRPHSKSQAEHPLKVGLDDEDVRSGRDALEERSIELVQLGRGRRGGGDSEDDESEGRRRDDFEAR